MIDDEEMAHTFVEAHRSQDLQSETSAVGNLVNGVVPVCTQRPENQ